MNSRRFVSFCDFCFAAVYLSRNELDRALEALRDALTVAQEGGFVTAGYCPRNVAAQLYDLALRHGICHEYATATIIATGLSPPCDHAVEKWPWPVRIYTLGRFTVNRNNVHLVFSGKTQKKPLELLKLLVAFGGREVGMSKLAHAMWPDTDGDVARATLRMTLLRLRRLIGEPAVVQQGNYLSLNPEYCWLDLWAFERLCDRHIDSLDAATHTRALFSLYRGSFLTDDDEPWIINQRERLRSKALRTIVDSAQQLESSNQAELAIAMYQKGVEIDPLAEDIYRRLMQCHYRLNRPAEALALYQRCRIALSRSLHIEPAMETRTLFREIQSQIT